MTTIQTIRPIDEPVRDEKGQEISKTDEMAALQFILDQPRYTYEKPYEIVFDMSNIPVDKRPAQTNLEGSVDYPPSLVRDLRNIPGDFTLKDNGFQIVNAPWLIGGTDQAENATISPIDHTWVESIYFSEVERIIEMMVEDVVEVFFFDWRIRTSDESKNGFQRGEYGDLRNRMEFQGPSGMVHIDNSDYGAEKRVWRHYEEERAESLLNHHFQQLNIWRPITPYPVQEYPLAVCDGSTVDINKDLHRGDLVSRTHVGEPWYPKYSDHYKWYYLSEQRSDEVMVLKMWDNDATAKARCCPHTAFELSGRPKGLYPRESIEVRALVFSKW